MIPAAPERLQHAVTVLCPDIERLIETNRYVRSERDLWRELSCCLLSSQVPYALAEAAAEAIDTQAALLGPKVDAVMLEKILLEPLWVVGKLRSYRFPAMRAAHLAATHRAVHDAAVSLADLLASFSDDDSARRWFVTQAPGLGPKQASMFLRNIGYSYRLAVLDRHVLNYMQALGLEGADAATPGTLARYHRCEARLVDHASALGYDVGLLDWAIWIVMRAARSLNREVVPT